MTRNIVEGSTGRLLYVAESDLKAAVILIGSRTATPTQFWQFACAGPQLAGLSRHGSERGR
jgi:hypothetical protein